MFASIAVTVSSCRKPGRNTWESRGSSGFRNAPVSANRVLSVNDLQAPFGFSMLTWYAGARTTPPHDTERVSTDRLKVVGVVAVASVADGIVVSAVMTSPCFVTAWNLYVPPATSVAPFNRNLYTPPPLP